MLVIFNHTFLCSSLSSVSFRNLKTTVDRCVNRKTELIYQGLKNAIWGPDNSGYLLIILDNLFLHIFCYPFLLEPDFKNGINEGSQHILSQLPLAGCITFVLLLCLHKLSTFVVLFRAPDKRVIEANSKLIFLISPQKHVVTLHLNSLVRPF